MTTPSKQSIFSSVDLARLIVDASPAGMLIVDSRGKIALANPQALQWFGYEEDDLLGQSIEMLIPMNMREGHQKHRTGYASNPHPRPMAAGRDLHGLRKDGSTFQIDISLHPIETPNEKMTLANIVDATPRHQAEKDRLLRQNMEKLALLGQLAGGVAHEIRTPLCIIGNDVYYLETIADQLNSDARDCIKEIKTAVSKANGIVSELLDFTRETTSKSEQCNLFDVVQPAIHLASIPSAVVVELDLTESEIPVAIDSDQIERIVVNLLTNAYQAMGESGKITIGMHTDAQSAYIRVTDIGPGVNAANLDLIFEPLFTTNAKGIGLGLAISRRYAQQNGGTLSLIDSSSSGTTFELKLPTTT